MNAYNTMGQSRIQQHDISAVLGTHGCRAGAFLAGLEKQRGWQADAEVERLLRESGAKPSSTAPRVMMLRQRIGAALVDAGQRLAGVPRSGAAPETHSTADVFGIAS